MKKKSLMLLCSVCFLLSSPMVYSDSASAYTANPNGASDTSDDTLTAYVKRLGEYLGYDLDTAITPNEDMLDATYTLSMTGLQILDVLFGATPVNSYYEAFTSNSNYSSINDQANATFTDYHSPNGADVSVTASFDQTGSQSAYQDDPVSQALFNILGTPNAETCNSSDTAAVKCLNQNEVMDTVLQDITDKSGNLPGETLYFSADNISKFISQLNVNTLIAPLIYTTTQSGTTYGLPAKNQQQQAAEFVRYAIGAVLPIDTMSESDYNTLWSKAKQSTTGQDQTTINAINDAKKELDTYLLSLRVYAAQSSVAISNLYGMLAKRMPQTTTASDGKTTTTTSQAFNEFQSATWRLYNPGASTQWVDQISQSSPATIQKEMAVLLSEINYQLYLTRQQQERILLTNSLQLIQMMANNKPSTEASNSNSAAETDTTQ